ncbi:cation-transporting ATPase [Microbacterium maritypicum]
MGKLDRLFGMAAKALDLEGGDRRDRDKSAARPAAHDRYAPPSAHDRYAPPPAPGTRHRAAAGTDADRAAIARYDYLLQTADPHRVEEIHREAFARLTPEQRTQVQHRMNAELDPRERPSSSSADDLARAAGRTEAARPGRMRGLLSRVGGFGAAGVVGGAAVGALGVVAVGAVGSAVAGPLLAQAAGLGVDFDALAQGVDLEAIASGLGAEDLAGAAEGFMGTAGETVSGLGDTAGEWGQKLGDLGIPGLGDLLGR